MKILYKYLSPTIPIFDNQLVGFSTRSLLNDPFEILPTSDAFLKLRDENKKEFFPLLEFSDGYERLHNPFWCGEFFKRFGVLCLTETKSNLLMWSHYADSHRGFVVGFDVSHPFFNQSLTCDFIELNEFLGKVKRVKYDNIRPSSNNPTDWIYTKSNDWIYEKEHRMLMSLESSDEVMHKSNGRFSVLDEDCRKLYEDVGGMGVELLPLYKIPSDAFVSLTLGANIDPLLSSDLIFKAREINPEIKIERARISADRYELEFV
ncbi:DUF2971 domain-containing protein [Vibrio alginolyticus]|uniref:DUF2971 domain-containing protein n=1 Tax=Vibrio alginolyticus TaxID=663 RepID=UPI001BD2BBEE|nr:DUF2971 domain-containing protein [Vibrio alginolyticus]MBS9930327.1 DUF2971 domain-containing protein [Vibrio alginolyticus]